MEASSFDEANVSLSPPKGMENICTSLAVYRGADVTGREIVISCWKLTQEEIDALMAGKRLWLIIDGQTMPPVALTTNNPFRQGDDPCDAPSAD